MSEGGTPGGAFRGLDRASLPMRLWAKAKVHGVWDPADVDFSQDRRDWLGLADRERECLLQLAALFAAGEGAVTADLLPLLRVVAAEGRIEEEIYLTSFLFEEAKHVDLFDRFLTEVAGAPDDLSRHVPASFERIFAEELPAALGRLATDASPEAQVRASVTYHMVIEGVMAETGYHLLQRILTRRQVLPGLRRAVDRLKRDEARHIAYGVYLLRRLILEHGDRAYRAFLERMGELRPLVVETTRQLTGVGRGGGFGVEVDELVRFSQRRFAGRVRRIGRARLERAAARAARPG